MDSQQDFTQAQAQAMYTALIRVASVTQYIAAVYPEINQHNVMADILVKSTLTGVRTLLDTIAQKQDAIASTPPSEPAPVADSNCPRCKGTGYFYEWNVDFGVRRDCNCRLNAALPASAVAGAAGDEGAES